MIARQETWLVDVSKFIKLLVFVVLFSGSVGAMAQPEQGSDVLRGFNDKAVVESDAVKIADQKKHQILFVMGALLLVGVLATAGLGVTMVVFGKQVFVAHMICAGFTVFLAVAHAITAMVWFFPY